MPSYDFKCPKCNLIFERNLKIVADHTKIECPDCSTVSNKLPPKGVLGMIGEPTSIPKDLDLAVGKDAEQKWQEYEERKNLKEQIRKEIGTQRLSKDPDGNYGAVEVTKDGQVVSEEESVNLRKEMFKEYNEIVKDPETKKITTNE